MKLSVRFSEEKRCLEVVDDATGELLENLQGFHLDCSQPHSHVLKVSVLMKTRHPLVNSAKIDG